jgi:HAMP domain-containing protein
MSQFVNNLRIGTKLAITSALAVVLVGIMIYMQTTGANSVREGCDTAVRQLTVAELATETKASLRGLQLGNRDIALSTTAADLQHASDYFAARQTSLVGYLDQMSKLSNMPENLERIGRLPRLVADLTRGKEQLTTIRSKIIALDAQNEAGDIEAHAQIGQLNADVSRLRKEVMLPLSSEMEALSNEIAEVGNEFSHHSIDIAAALSASVERTTMMIGAFTALLLIATWVFSIFVIARPIRNLNVSMLELAEGNFAVVLLGLGRKDEIGDVAGAVEKF